MINRRQLIGYGMSAAGGLIVPAAAQDGAALTVSLPRDTSGPIVPRDFLGLSYETQQLETNRFFTASNRPLVDAFRGLSASGILRIGGNTSEFSWWKERSDDRAPQRETRGNRAGQPRSDLVYAVTPAAIDALDGFLRATGWRCIYGLNLGNAVHANIAREAVYVQRRLGQRLVAFAIGNEPDLFEGRLRPKKWSAENYLEEWVLAARAVMGAAPRARFILPDLSHKIEWLKEIAQRWPTIKNPPAIEALSHHYYVGGARDPYMKPARLLSAAPVLAHGRTASEAARAIGTKWRMTEGNSAFHGGKPGVSDSFVAALWAADYLLALMSLGYSGANLHGGAGPANSVGGLPGEQMLPDKAPRPRPFYTPIGEINGQTQPQPVYWGMRFAGLFSGARIRPVTIDNRGQKVAAYAADTAQGTLLALVNKEVGSDVRVALPRHRRFATLTGPALDSREVHLDLARGPLSMAQLTVARTSAAMVLLPRV